MTHEVLFPNHVVEEQRNGQLEDRRSSDPEEALFLEPLSSVHSIILDWTSACFIDSVGAKAVKQVLMLFKCHSRAATVSAQECLYVSC